MAALGLYTTLTYVVMSKCIVSSLHFFDFDLAVGNAATQDTSERSHGKFFWVISMYPFFIFFRSKKL